jgi:hypothetical protein
MIQQPHKWLASGQIEYFKWLAILTMVIDHIGLLFDIPAYRLLGRWAFPCFALLIGYNSIFHTKNPHSYLRRLLILGLISQPVTMWVFQKPTVNILFTLSLGLVAASALQQAITAPTLSNLLRATLPLLPAPLVSYGLPGVLLVCCAATPFLHAKPLRLLSVMGLLAVGANAYQFSYALAAFSWLLPATLISLSPHLHLARSPRLLFYAFYPAHLIVLQLLRYII